ncbi:MAG TPA: GGDEF domain-containing protein [bacterium]
MNFPTPFWALFLMASAAVLMTITLFSVRDILRRRQMERAIRDGLTGSYSSDFIREVYHAELRRAARTGVPFSVAFLALHERDGSKTAVGAQVALAQWLHRNIRSSDYVGRMGNEEFALVLPETWEDDATDLLRRISTSLRYSPSGNSREVTLTWDSSVATWSPDHPAVWETAHERLHPRPETSATPGMSLGNA